MDLHGMQGRSRAQRINRPGKALLVVALCALVGGGCASDAGAPDDGPSWGGNFDPSAGAYGGGGSGDAGATSDTGGGASDTGGSVGWDVGSADSSASDTGGSWWGDDTGTTSDAGASWGSDAGASADAGTGGSDAGGEADTEPPQSWQQKEDAPPLAEVSVGGGHTLQLRKMRVTVRIEGARARVLVDHIFENPYDKQLEGTFRYTLPTGASISYYAMFPGSGAASPSFFGSGDALAGKGAGTIAGTSPHEVTTGSDKSLWGVPMVARVQRTQAATKAYETETEQQIDPALVEAVAPNTFSAKVFPIAAKGHNRVLVAWEQTLTSIGGMPLPGAATATGRVLEYAFPVPKGQLDSFDFTLLARKAQVAAGHALTGAGLLTPAVEKTTAAGYLAATTLSGASLPGGQLTGGKLLFHLLPAGDNPLVDAVVSADPVTKKDYAWLRVRPEIPGLAASATMTSPHAVFLVDTSRSAHPTRFAAALSLLEQILQASPATKSFNVIPFDAGASWLAPKWLDNNAAGRKKALDALSGVLLEGASDIGAALHVLANPTWKVSEGTAVDVFLLTDGAITWGDRGEEAVVARFEDASPWAARVFAYRLGVGAENAALFERLTAKSGAVFNCPAALALSACAQAHTSASLRLTKVSVQPAGAVGGAIDDLLIGGRQSTLFPGGTLVLAGPLASTGPATVLIEGQLPDGKSVSWTTPVMLNPDGQLAPRAWAEIAIHQLLDSADKKFEGLAMALSQHYRVINRLSSFLVLEDDKAFEKYDLGSEKAKFKGQPLAALVAAASKIGQHLWSTFARLKVALDQRPKGSKPVPESLLSQALGVVGKSGMELKPAGLAWGGLSPKDVPAAYLKALDSKQLDLVAPFTVEGERRVTMLADLPAAVRALSTALERSPGDTEIQRLVAYRLATWGLHASASQLLLDVLLRRPFEPQSWRDLAHVAGKDRPGLAMLLFEAALSGAWDAKFKKLKQVIGEEYGLFVSTVKSADPKHPLVPLLEARLKARGLKPTTADLRVTITWNTNNTDVDLWVTTPTGEKCDYGHKVLSTGGGLLEDLIGGYGPERFQVTKALKGTWKVQVHYYNQAVVSVASPTWVAVTIARKVGTPEATVSHHNVLLKHKGNVVTVAEVEFK